MIIHKTKDGFVTDTFLKQKQQQHQNREKDVNNQNQSQGKNHHKRTKKRTKLNSNERNHAASPTKLISTNNDHAKQPATVTPVKKHQDRIIDAEQALAMGIDAGKGSDNYLTDCVFFMQNRCTKGDKCEFRHNDAAKSNTKTCKYWLRGACHILECVYKHPSRKTPVCTFYLQGTCNKGASCPFLHPIGAKPTAPSTGIKRMTVREAPESLEQRENDTDVETENPLTGVNQKPPETPPATSKSSTPIKSVGVKRSQRPASEQTSIIAATDESQQLPNKKPKLSGTTPSTISSEEKEKKQEKEEEQEKEKNDSSAIDFEKEMALIDELLADE